MSDISEKTIFVLDHTQYFSISSEDYIPLDYLKGKPSTSSGVDNLPSATGISANEPTQFSKSLWTCSVESSIEYCRIVWDLFPREKLVRFIVSDTAAHIVNTWNPTTQNMSHVLNAMALVGVPQRNTPQSTEYSVVHGLRAAIEALAEPTERQLHQTKSEPLLNKGRVICITSARDNPSMKSLEDIFHTVLLQQNALVVNQPNKMLHIDHCHLVIINVVPMGMETLVTNRALLEISAALSSEVHTTCAPDISNKLTHLIMKHYDLASTTVTGIPMKEEQNANSSANYDVEILHARNAHTILCGNELVLPTSIREGSEYETVTLKWCTPRGCGADAQLCMALHRVTPVDVTSRPSSCLINFLLNGRTVLLEMPRKTGGKITSHLLSAQGGEIFIHVLQITRSLFDELPSISEGYGGRLTDYRIADFASFAKSQRFVPLKGKGFDENLTKIRERLYRRSMYFPLTLSNSMLYNLMLNTDFLRKVTKENMDKADEMLCQQQIFEQIYTPAKYGEILPFKNTGFKRMKDNKKMEQYKLLLTELELLIRSYATTPSHRALLETVKNFRSAYVTATKNDAEGNSKNIIRATTDSPLSPPHSMDTSSSNSSTAPVSNQRTLLDIFLLAERNQTSKRLEFSGRLCTPIGQVAKLYPHLGAKEKEEQPQPQPTA